MPENEAGAAPRQPHISITRWREAAQYVYPRLRRERRERREDYHAHAEALLGQLGEALGNLPPPQEDVRIPVDGLKRGVLVEVETMVPSERAKATKIPALDFPAQEIVVLRSERSEDRTERAVVFVPDDARAFLTGRIAAYGSEDLGNHERPDIDKFEVIEAIRAAAARTLVVGTPDLASPAPQWWELWLRRPDAIVEAVVAAAQQAGLDVYPDRLQFPETSVIFVLGTAEATLGLVGRLNGAISEVRRASQSIEPFLDQGDKSLGQHALVAEYCGRVTPPPADAPVVCVIDTGVAAAHPLIAPALAGAWTVNDAWGTDDHAGAGGHGTGMASLVLHGDLLGPMSGQRQVVLGHAVESVKFLPPGGFPATEPARYGIITQAAVAVAEIERANIPRSFCIATSSPDLSSEAPSSWSGAVDQICAGSMPGEQQAGLAAKDHPKRLVLIATGNMDGGLKAVVE